HVLTTDGVEHGGVMEIAGHGDIGDGDVLEATVLDLAFDCAGDDGLNAFGHSGRTGVIHHEDHSLRFDSCTDYPPILPCPHRDSAHRCGCPPPCRKRRQKARAPGYMFRGGRAFRLLRDGPHLVVCPDPRGILGFAWDLAHFEYLDL